MRPPRSGAAGTDRREPWPQDVLAVGDLLASRGVFGLVWLSAGLVVTQRYGALADRVVVGRPVTEALPLLMSYEADIAALRANPGQVLELPAITIQSTDAPAPKLNLLLVHEERSGCDVLLISRTSVGNDLELQLSQQIRDRLILEREARALAARLERANRDLEEFASIISHDLKAPMRAMRFLLEDAEGQLGSHAPAAQALARVREQAERLNGMLSALFDYSRAGQKQDVVARVDLGRLVHQIVRAMPNHAGLDIQVTGSWPTLDTIAAPLDLVLRNLIDNAVKHHDRATARIEICAIDRGAHLEIAVSDDGPGIAPRHHATVLQPFRRLAKDATPGSGMGLALVKRTLDGLGARLDIVSDPAVRRGTTFRIMWPKTIEAG